MADGGNVRDRFWSRVDKGNDPGSCWNWTGAIGNHGYGVIAGEVVDGELALTAKRSTTHRVSWMLANGQIPADGPGHHGWVVMHKCDNRACVNPDHLVLGTQQQNISDMDGKGRARRRENHRSGPSHAQSVLTAEQEAEVLATRDPARTVAARFGVCKSVIQRVRRQNMTPEQLSELRLENYRKRFA